MTEPTRLLLISLALMMLSTIGLSTQSSNPRVSVVIGKNAPQLEKFAASELCNYLEKLFDVKTQPTSDVEGKSEAIFLIGSPATNPAIKSFPKVSDQGIVIERLSASPTMVVGGGSARATMWAVYELVERLGVRYLLYRDAIPPKSQFRMPDLHVLMEPTFRVRAHGTTNVDFADSGEGWGIKDFRPLIDLLAKRKFNRINVGGYA